VNAQQPQDLQSQLNLLEFQVKQIVENTSGIPDVLKEIAVQRAEFENYREQVTRRMEGIDESRTELQASIVSVANRIESRYNAKFGEVEVETTKIHERVAAQQRWIWTCVGGGMIIFGMLSFGASMVNDGIRALIEANKQAALLEYRVKKIEEFAALGEHK
jgi:hypothetical protein